MPLFFPTPRGALEGLGRLAPLRTDARVLEAGCGLGDGLRELHAEFPQTRIDGIEWSWPLRVAVSTAVQATHTAPASPRLRPKHEHALACGLAVKIAA